jgi:hypothetical protein
MMNRGHRRADNREFSRVEQEFPVTVLEAQVSTEKSKSSAAANSYLASAIARKATGMNISRGGLAFDAQKPYRIGTILAFEVVLPEPQEDFLPLVRRFVQRQVKGFRSLCQVVWIGAVSIGHYRMGVRFIDSNERRSAALGELLTEYEWQHRFMSAIEEPENRWASSDDEWDEPAP